MIIMWYCGGLGNQMYQLALQTALEKMYPEQKFFVDVSHYYLLDEHDGFELGDKFGFKYEQASRDDVRRLFNGYIPSKNVTILPLHIRKKIAYSWQFLYLKINNRIHKDKRKSAVYDANNNEINDKIYELQKGDWYIRGLWQNLNYFDKYREAIIKRFDFQIELSEDDKKNVNMLENGDAVAVHVRGGDFLTNTHNLCGKKYYEHAYAAGRFDKPLLVFTDDVEYAKKVLPKVEILDVVSHSIEDSLVDMYMISRAKHIITSNSTFSFWGAYLNNQSGGTIVYPKYLSKNGDEYRPYIGRQEWIMVDNAI